MKYLDLQHISLAKKHLRAFGKREVSSDGCSLSELSKELDFIHETFYVLIKKEGFSRYTPLQTNVMLSQSQATAIVALAKACLDYLYFHNDTANRSGWYQVFSSHGSKGGERALEVLNALKELTDGNREITDEVINVLRKKFIEESLSFFKGEHSLQTYLEKTPLVETPRPIAAAVKK